jgi:predicted nucleic acid-binding protein
MSGREFVDTNVLIYAFDRSAGAKRELALTLLDRLWAERCGCVSLQVLQEFYVTATRKLSMPAGDALKQVERLGVWAVHRPSFDDLTAAVRMHCGKSVSFWDALVVRSAMQMGCEVLWTEDLSDGQRWEGVTVKNPFRP